MSNLESRQDQRCEFSRLSDFQKRHLEEQAIEKARIERSRIAWRILGRIFGRMRD